MIFQYFSVCSMAFVYGFLKMKNLSNEKMKLRFEKKNSCLRVKKIFFRLETNWPCIELHHTADCNCNSSELFQ